MPLSTRKVGGAAVLIAGAFAAIVGAAALSPALAGDDGAAPLWTGIGGMVGIAGGDKEPAIDYRERARLVLPPKMVLPPPGAGAQKSASWPVDPDVEKIRKDKEAKKTILESQSDLQAARDGNRLSPDQLRVDRAKPGERHSATACAAQSNKRGCDFVPFRNVMETFGFAKTDVVAGEEPDRDWLTDPPKGYRMPTASTSATFDVAKKQSNDPRAELYKAPEQQ